MKPSDHVVSYTSVCHIIKTLHIAFGIVLYDFTISTVNSDYSSKNINWLDIIIKTQCISCQIGTEC